MPDPYEVLGLSPDADDNTIRSRYLALVRENPPERAPEKFAVIRQAYELLKDGETRLKKRLFEVDKHLSIDTIIEEWTCKSPRPRVSLAKLIEMASSR
jgi:preprotein translocase subunit Sec63